MRKHLTINALPALLLCLCILCSCDGLKHTLGMKTSYEIEQMRQMDYKTSQRQKMLQDSLAAVEAAERAVAENPGLDKRYYVILGSFKEQSNVDLMVRDAKAFNFNPIVIPCSNGFTMVAASGHSTLPEACSARIKVEELDICPYDIWIYDTNQGLHK